MTLRKISHLSLADQVFAQLTGEIVRGSYAPDSYLPAERTLAVTFSVNRHVVREALKRLEQLGLVHVAQGGGTRVLDYREHAGLDLLALLAEHPSGGADTLAFWFSVLEVRAAQSCDIVRLCCLRGTRELKQELVAIAAQMQAAADDNALYELELRFWDRAIAGTGNVVYRLSYNSMRRAVDAMGEEAKKWSVREIKAAKYRVQLAAAIAGDDADAAEAHIRGLMQAGLSTVAALMKPKPAAAVSADVTPSAATAPRTRTTRAARAAKPARTART